MIRAGFQIPNFNHPGVDPSELFERTATMARAAEHAGFDTVMVMDHFYQLPMLGPPQNYMLEAYTLLGGIAARTERVRLGTLVSGNTYRNPALLAKTVTTLDIVSGGRAICGVGAGWFEPEHEAYGFEFPRLGKRLDRLEEALGIIVPMLRDERPTLEGRFYRVKQAINQPAPISSGGVPLLIGGNGEKRTLRLVAQHAQESNLTCSPAEIPRKLRALEAHCKDVGRDRAEINVTWMGSVVVAPSHDEALAELRRFLGERGIDWDALPEDARARMGQMVVFGSPDEVAGRLRENVFSAGINGVIVNLPANGHDPERIALTAETLRSARP